MKCFFATSSLFFLTVPWPCTTQDMGTSTIASIANNLKFSKCPQGQLHCFLHFCFVWCLVSLCDRVMSEVSGYTCLCLVKFMLNQKVKWPPHAADSTPEFFVEQITKKLPKNDKPL